MSLLNYLQLLSPAEFEWHCLAGLNRVYGSRTPGLNRRGATNDDDQGVDIEGLIDGKSIGFQCKTGRMDGSKIREVHRALARYPFRLDKFVLLCSVQPLPKALDQMRKLSSDFATAAGPVANAELWGPDEMVLKLDEDFLREASGSQRIQLAMARHAAEFNREFNAVPVWDIAGSSLSQIYMDLDCGQHTWSELQDAARRDLAIDPFSEGSSDRKDLLKTTLNLINLNAKEFIVIQGTPGAGKSTFTLRLACYLHGCGVPTLRVRLRDLEIMDDALEAIAKKSLGVHRDVLELALRSQTKTVLILDGWDEFALDPSEALSHRIGTFLASLRSSVLHGGLPNVQVVLTGRPSHAVTRSESLAANTQILTIRPLLPEQLRTYLGRLHEAYGDGFSYPIEQEAILQSYEEEWLQSSDTQFSPPRGAIDVIGWPLLAHIAYRLLGECEPGRQRDLIMDRTGLLRCLMEYSCRHSRIASDKLAQEQILSRFDPSDLRSLVQETAIAITRSGTEYISRNTFEQVLAAQVGAEERDKRVDLAHKADILIVNFFFKATATRLGCEFVHKAMREFAFAEALVDRLKILAIVPTTPREALKRELADQVSMTELLSTQWLTGDIWKYVQHQLLWELFRDQDRYEDPVNFRRVDKGIGLDAWCRVRDRIAVLWEEWDLANLSSAVSTEVVSGAVAGLADGSRLNQSLSDARLGDALFRLCGAIHATVAHRLLGDLGLVSLKESFWSGRELMSIDTMHQTSIFEAPDPRIRFFSPFKSGMEDGDRSLKGALARINSRKPGFREELADHCDLGYISMVGAQLQRVSLLNCEMGHCNLKECDLTAADLSASDMSYAWLSKANLTRANLRLADLQYACLAKAQLSAADLTEANLANADFTGAKGLTVEQVLRAENWSIAKFDPDFAEALRATGKDTPILYGRRPPATDK